MAGCMKKYHCYSADFDLETEELFKSAVFLGQGNNGIVYKLKGGKAIKIFVEERVCKDEVYILKRTEKSKYFPKMLKHGKLYLLREMVEGVQLDKYIKNNGLDLKVTQNLYKMIKEFERLKFSRLDTRCKDIYIDVNNNKRLKLIDPKNFYKKKMSFPRHLMKGLFKLGVLEDFYTYMEQIDKKKCLEWHKRFDQYLEKERAKLML